MWDPGHARLANCSNIKSLQLKTSGDCATGSAAWKVRPQQGEDHVCSWPEWWLTLVCSLWRLDNGKGANHDNTNAAAPCPDSCKRLARTRQPSTVVSPSFPFAHPSTVKWTEIMLNDITVCNHIHIFICKLCITCFHHMCLLYKYSQHWQNTIL